jgi:hypothetical protein
MHSTPLSLDTIRQWRRYGDAEAVKKRMAQSMGISLSTRTLDNYINGRWGSSYELQIRAVWSDIIRHRWNTELPGAVAAGLVDPATLRQLVAA